MPRTSKKGNYRRKRRAPYSRRRSYRKYRVRHRHQGPSRVVSRTSPFPDNYFTKMKYCQNMDLVTTSGLAYRFFRTNGLFDPDVAPHIAGDGQHQPFGFDQLAVLYRRYRVYGMKYVATAVGGGYCRLQMPLKRVLGVRGIVTGHRLGTKNQNQKEMEPELAAQSSQSAAQP